MCRPQGQALGAAVNKAGAPGLHGRAQGPASPLNFESCARPPIILLPDEQNDSFTLWSGPPEQPQWHRRWFSVWSLDSNIASPTCLLEVLLLRPRARPAETETLCGCVGGGLCFYQPSHNSGAAKVWESLNQMDHHTGLEYLRVWEALLFFSDAPKWLALLNSFLKS